MDDLRISMKRAAAVQLVTPKEGDLFVWDSRNNHSIGPYRPRDIAHVEGMAQHMNQQVLQWELGELAKNATKIEGPFYVKVYHV